MKPLDLLQQLAVFQVAMAGTEFPNEVKLKVAEEVFHALPPEALCSSCPATRTWVGDQVLAVIEHIKATNDRTNTQAQEAPQGATAPVRHGKARKEPVGK